jgi:glutamine amidotransferase
VSAIVLVDVCSGNLRSVARALTAVGATVIQTRDPDVVRKADKIVVPGQGAFGAFVRGLAATGLGEALTEKLRAGTPYLGICLGMQVLFETSDEDGRVQAGAVNAPLPGLGLIAGRVVRLHAAPARVTRGEGESSGFATGEGTGKFPGNVVKIPHMGWNQVHRPTDIVRPPDAVLQGIADGAHVYFVHSYAVQPRDRKVIALTTDYGGEFCSAVRQDNLFACQFHPEKSQAIGLAILRNFVEDLS